MTDGLRFRWLGTAGIELEFRGERILIDPYLSRFPIWNAVLGRPKPKREIILRHLSPARAVLVSHSHFDHLADVPDVCRKFGAVAYGSPNTSAILRVHDIPAAQVKTVTAGDAISIEPFHITIFSGRHGRMAGLLPYTGKLPAHLKLPLRLSDYRMDSMFSFHVRTTRASCLVWNSPDTRDIPRADLLFFCPLWGKKICAMVAEAAQAKWIVPIHWDDFFLPVDRPLHPLIVPPGWSSPWLRRMEPNNFARSVNRILPNVRVLIPDILKQYSAELT
jgi:L-ascorbate metabolism protein UlaG (beta-lactamase superfamily)